MYNIIYIYIFSPPRRLAAVLRARGGGAGGPPAGGGVPLQQPALAGLHGDGGRGPGAHLPVARLQGPGAHARRGPDRRRQHPGPVSLKALFTRPLQHSDAELYLCCS